MTIPCLRTQQRPTGQSLLHTAAACDNVSWQHHSDATPQAQAKRGMAYGGRPLWSRSPRSSPRTGKPSTWRRRTGGFDGIQQRGMHNAKCRNCIERHTRTRRTRIAAGEHLSATLQPEPLPAGLRSHLLKPGSYDQGHHRRDHGRYVTGENRPHHRSLALRAVPVDAGATGQHSQA